MAHGAKLRSQSLSLDRRPREIEPSRRAGRVQRIPSANEPLAKVVPQRFGVAPSFRPLLVLANQVGVDFGLVCEIVGDGAVNLFKPKQLEVLADRLRRLSAAERIDQGVVSRLHNSYRPAVRCIPSPMLLSFYLRSR